MTNSYGQQLRFKANTEKVTSFIGVYDLFSATLAAKHADALFLGGFGFAASFYGLPDIGFISWSDMVQYVQRVRTVLPDHHLLVDIDDGYGDPEVACHVVRLMEAAGASGVVLEDQRRPRRCGHFDGKQLLDLDEYLVKLEKVLKTRKDLFVIARTDSSDIEDIVRRVTAFSEAGADAVLVDGLRDLSLIPELKKLVKVPITFNQIAGGKSPAYNLPELSDAGISLVIYSTPCLFAAQSAIQDALTTLMLNKGSLGSIGEKGIGVGRCTAVLAENLERSSQKMEEVKILVANC
jgi:2-methylisocitrate lyase-like PEP mutase family enzyme